MQLEARQSRWAIRYAISAALVLAGTLRIPPDRSDTVLAAPQSATPVEDPDDLHVLAVASDEGPVARESTPGPALGGAAGGPAGPRPATRAAPPTALDLPADEATADLKSTPLPEDPGAAVAAAAAPATDPESEATADDDTQLAAISFHGVQPGATTFDQVKQAWGDPAEVVMDDHGESVHVYAVEDFRRVQLRLADDVVASIVIDLERPMATAELVDALSVGQIRAVDLVDPHGRLVGRAFPERGVVFGLTGRAEAALVEQVILEPIDVEPFILRVESDLHGPYQANLRDLNYVLACDPDAAHPYWLRAEVLLAIGQLSDAEHAAASAIGLAPQVPEYRLTRAACLARLGRHPEAVELVDELLQADDLPERVEAQALMQMGDLVASDGSHAHKKAVDYYLEAIRVADQVAADNSAAVRRAAHELQIDAHLAVACDIAWGRWRRKSQVVPKWIERASRLADQTIQRDNGSRELRLRVARKALHALVGTRATTEPDGWVSRAETAAAEAVAEVHDTLWAARIRRQLGTVYFHAGQLAHAQGRPKQALRYGHLALDHLAAEAEDPNRTPEARFLLGQLRFQIGAILAVHREDHHQAVEWYDKAAADLVQPTPVSPEANPWRHGDALVSMGVSYWEVDQREKALELTKLGTEMIKQAVSSGLAEESALSVPYGNLATMHDALGDTGQARKFAQLAKESAHY